MITLDLPRNTCIYKLAGAETFRSSSAALFGYGTNLQNIEKSMRGNYWADSGKTLVQVDQSGAEALIVAYLCKEGRFRDLFLHNVKPHVFVAMNVFLHKWQMLVKDLDVASFASTPIAELKNKEGWKVLDKIIKESDNWQPSERYYYIAKMICHASNYGMKGGAFQMNVLEKSRGQIVLSRQQADDYLMRYHSLFPEITSWHRWVEKFINDNGRLYNLFGHPREVTGTIGEYDFKEWYAFCPQSTVGIITHNAITQLQNFIEEHNLDWDILNNCHDSMMFQVPLGTDFAMLKRAQQFMEPELTSPAGEKFNMRSEIQIGLNWGPKKKTNELGVQEVTHENYSSITEYLSKSR